MARGKSTTFFLAWAVLSLITSTARAAVVVPDKAFAVFAFGVVLCALAWFAFRGVVLAEVLCFVLAVLFGASAILILLSEIASIARAGIGSPLQPIAAIFWFALNGVAPIAFCVLFLRETPKTGVRTNLWRYPFSRGTRTNDPPTSARSDSDHRSE